jgi:leucyl aminopeptidase
MTAYIARNATESIGFIITQSDVALTNWSVKLSKEYISIPTHQYELGP